MANRCPNFRAGKLYSKSLLVVGGWLNKPLSSVEILDPGSSEWRKGPELPFPVYASAMVEHPRGGVVLIGGESLGQKMLATMLYLSDAGTDARWEEMPLKLKTAKSYLTAFLITDEVTHDFDNGNDNDNDSNRVPFRATPLR